MKSKAKNNNNNNETAAQKEMLRIGIEPVVTPLARVSRADEGDTADVVARRPEYLPPDTTTRIPTW